MSTMTSICPEVVTFGEEMVLLLAEPGIPLGLAQSFRRSIAGAEGNVAIGLARLGHRAAWFGRIGDDPFGQAVLRALRADGVDVSRARVDPDASTGLLVRDCDPIRTTDVLYFRHGSAGSRLAPEDVDAHWIAGARLLHVTGITPALSSTAYQATLRAVHAAKAAGVTIAFDPNIRRKLISDDRARELLMPLVAQADLVLAGADEAQLLTGCNASTDAAEVLRSAGPRLVIVKNGSEGSWATDGTRTWTQPAVPVPAVDPVGAGDAYAAGFLSAWLRDCEVSQAMLEAAVVAAMVVRVPTDVEGFPDARQRDTAVRAATGCTVDVNR
jgi:2-dehydro-3-deoxygluconokinase